MAYSELFVFAFGLGVLIYIVASIISRDRKRSLFCSHEFRLRDMKHRDNQGLVKWPCHKCKKLFMAESGLEILHKGKCIGD